MAESGVLARSVYPKHAELLSPIIKEIECHLIPLHIEGDLDHPPWIYKCTVLEILSCDPTAGSIRISRAACDKNPTFIE